MDERVFGLMEAAEWHQKAAEKATQAFEAKTCELAQALMLSRQAMLDALKAGAAEGTKAALSEAAQQVTHSLGIAAEKAKRAGDELSKEARRFSWRWAGMRALIAVAAILAILWSAMITSDSQRNTAKAWETETIRLQAEAERLRGEVSQLQADVEDLEKRGGKIKLTTCNDGKKQRICLPVAKIHTTKGFLTDEKGRNFVIPDGY